MQGFLDFLQISSRLEAMAQVMYTNSQPFSLRQCRVFERWHGFGWGCETVIHCFPRCVCVCVCVIVYIQEPEGIEAYELEELLTGLTRLAHRVCHLPARNPRET